MRLQSSLHGEERALVLSDIPRVFWGFAAFLGGYAVLLVLEESLRMQNGLSPIAVSAGLAVGVLVRLRGATQAVFAATQFVVGAAVGVIAGGSMVASTGASAIATGC